MVNNNPSKNRISIPPTTTINTKKSSVHKTDSKHQKSHRLAVIFAFSIILPLFIFILIEFIMQFSLPESNYHFLSENSGLDLQIEELNGDTVRIDFSKTEGIVECILTPSMSKKYILNAFTENKTFYNKFYVEYNSYINEDPKLEIKIGEYSPINTLICRHIRKEGNKIEFYKPIEMRSGILYYKQPKVPTDLEAKTHGNCIFLTGKKPINQDIICKAGNRNNTETWENLLENKSEQNGILYIPGIRGTGGYSKPFEIIKCDDWENVKEIECSSNISIQNDLLGEHHKSLENVFLKEEQVVKLSIEKNENKPITECLINKNLKENIENLVLIEDSLLEGYINCDNVKEESINRLNDELKKLNNDKEFIKWNNTKIKEFISVLKTIVTGSDNENTWEKLGK